MINIVLVNPEIPSNTGNIVRTCVATGSVLHLVRPLGFDTSDKMLKRAGLDYWQDADIRYYDNVVQFLDSIDTSKMYLFSTKGQIVYSDVNYPDDCYLVFGRETKGLDETFLANYYSQTVRVPMIGQTRSLNLSNTVALAVYEVLRQGNFAGFNSKGHLSIQ